MASSSSRNARSGHQVSAAAWIASRLSGHPPSEVHGQRRGALGAAEAHRHMLIGPGVIRDRRVQRLERHALLGLVHRDRPEEALGALLQGLLKAGEGRDGVHEAPLQRSLALHALRRGGEEVREVASDLSLVYQPSQTAGAGQNAQERRLWEAHSRVAVVDEEDVVAGQRELIAATRGRSAQSGQKLQT